jgi:hypothetical protein
MAFYPTIRDETILSMNVVLQNLEKDPDYLDSPECPYSPSVISFFRARGKGKEKEEVDNLFALEEGETDIDKIEEQVKAIINDLEDFGRKLNVSDSTDKMGYFRTKTSLVDKLLTMQERVYSIREINEFKTILLGFMDEVLTKDQITDFMTRLDGVLGTKNDDIS